MKRPNKGYEMGRTTQFPKNPSEHLVVDRVKGLCKIDEIVIEVKILLYAFFLLLASREEHISCAATSEETTQGFCKNGW